MSRGLLWGLLAATVLALALRCPELGVRPMHNDEAVNAIKFRQLWEHGSYTYDPNEHHGPALFFLTHAWAKLTGAPDFADFSEARLRLVTVAFGAGLILLLPLAADGLGRGGTIGAAFLCALSPAMVFYSRYYIHETLLVFFTFLALAAGWRYSRSRKMGWALLGGLAAGLMQATKETFVLALAAAAVALVMNRLGRREGRPDGKISLAAYPGHLEAGVEAGSRWTCCWHLTAAVAVWLAVAVLLFTSFFSNPAGVLDSLRTYAPWLRRAAGDTPHLHSWSFYLQRLTWFHAAKGPVWSEALILALAVPGGMAAFTRKAAGGVNQSLVRFLVFYTVVLAVVYSAIPYKTPWCLIGFWHGAILVAGVGAAAVWHWLPQRWMRAAGAVVLVAGGVQLGGQAWLASTKYSADPGNPYVYAQTSTGLLDLVRQVEALARVSPEGRHMVVKVMAPEDDYWPLPWYLRAYDQTGWWRQVPDDPYAPVMIVSTQLDARLDGNKTHVMAGLFELRPQVFLELYVRLDLWSEYLKTRPRPKQEP